MLTVELAVAKTPKWAVRESGDSVEVVERPNGGLSIVIVDGQRSGRSAKAISNIAVRKAISLLAEGVRDGAVARATHDYLRTQRGGQVSAELIIISIDLESRSLVISRNSQCPVLVGQQARGGELHDMKWRVLDEPSDTVGVHARSRPVITEDPLESGQLIIAFTDGILHAGSRHGAGFDVRKTLDELTSVTGVSAQELADGLIAAALTADEGRPGDDISVVVLVLLDKPQGEGVEVRRMAVSFPVAPI